MTLQESGEMYLETILILSMQSDKVRSIDISRHMGFSKPSVSRAVNLLNSQKYISVAPDGAITLTKTGHEIAEKIYERHEVLTKCLILLGVNETAAAEDACRIEHVISDSTFNAIKAKIKNQK